METDRSLLIQHSHFYFLECDSYRRGRDTGGTLWTERGGRLLPFVRRMGVVFDQPRTADAGNVSAEPHWFPRITRTNAGYVSF